MKILYVCRLYSGFEESLRTGIWNPKGAPTIARMIERLDDPNFTIIFTQMGHSDAPFPKHVQIKGFKASVTVLSGPSALPHWLWKFRDKISSLSQLYHIRRICGASNPDLIYCDRVNIFPAAILSRFTKTPVIWRVMGVLQIMHNAAKAKTLRGAILRWLWHSPFACVICTRDGSDGGPWLEENLRSDVPRHMLLNGINLAKETESVALPKGTKALFVGRLEPMKGTEEFLDAVAIVPNLQAIIVGDGSLLSTMQQQAKALGIFDRTYFLGALSQFQLKHVRQHCDFYVSLNTHGNLTNVNLEALSDHLPTIIPRSTHVIDRDTDQLIPEDVFYRFGKVGETAALGDAMTKMMNKAVRQSYQKNMASFAPTVLSSWNERVEREISIYEDALPYDTAVFIADLGSGGAQKVAIALAADLIQQGERIAVITLSDSTQDFHTLPNGTRRIVLDRYNEEQGLLANIGRIMELRNALKRHAPRQVISFIAPTNILAVWACIGLKTRLIISERNDPARQSFGKMWDVLRYVSYRFADKVTANSENAIASLKLYVPAQKLHFIPNALDSRHALSGERNKIILIVGRLHPQKSHTTLLEAFAETREEHPDWSLIIVGQGPLREALEEQCRALGVEEFVTFSGVVNNPYEYYEKASIFVLPSLHEGTPNALLEAMSCEVAPIVSDACEGALPYITHNQSGIVVPVKNSNALADALKALMADPIKRAKFGTAAKENIEPLYKISTGELWRAVLEGS